MKYTINNQGFNTKAELKAYYRQIFESYKRQEILSREDHIAIFHLLRWHPKYEEKTSKSIKHIKVDVKEHRGYYTNNAFWLVHHDNTETSFSYPTCVNAIKPNKTQKDGI